MPEDFAGSVSVIVPVFNVEPYLHRCLDSILAQTHSRLEVVLVDDGSTDRSGQICDDYADSDGRVRVIHQANAGLSAARNVGLAATTGEFVLFVDSDDWLHQQAVEHLLAVASSQDADVVVGGFERVTDSGPPLGAQQQKPELLVFTPEQALSALMGRWHTLMTIACGKLFDRKLLDGIEFPVGRLHEDEFTTYRILDRASRVAVVPGPLYFYRQHPHSITGAGFSRLGAEDAIAAYEERLEYLREAGRVDLLALARAQLFRRYLRLHRGSSPDEDLRAVLTSMRHLARDMRRHRDISVFTAFASVYAWFPAVTDRLYTAYDRFRRGRRQP